MLLSFNTNLINWGNTLFTHIATNQHTKVSSLFSHKTIQPPPHLSTQHSPTRSKASAYNKNKVD